MLAQHVSGALEVGCYRIAEEIGRSLYPSAVKPRTLRERLTGG
jgi:hypothetical protein